jgi:hypothetical protein
MSLLKRKKREANWTKKVQKRNDGRWRSETYNGGG